MKETTISPEHQDRLGQLRQGYINIDAVDQILNKNPDNIVVVNMGFGDIDIDKDMSRVIKHGFSKIYNMLKKDGLEEEAKQQIPSKRAIYERNKNL